MFNIQLLLALGALSSVNLLSVSAEDSVRPIDIAIPKYANYAPVTDEKAVQNGPYDAHIPNQGEKFYFFLNQKSDQAANIAKWRLTCDPYVLEDQNETPKINLLREYPFYDNALLPNTCDVGVICKDVQCVLPGGCEDETAPALDTTPNDDSLGLCAGLPDWANTALATTASYANGY